MVGRKRNANQINNRPGVNGSAEDGPDIYGQMLAEAGVTSRARDNPERPLKRRRPGSSHADKQHQASESADSKFEAWLNASEKHDSDEDEDALELEDVDLPVPTVQTMERDSEDDYDEEDDDMQFEDIDFGALNTDQEPTAPTGLELNLTAQQSVGSSNKVADRRKPITKDERERRIEIHKIHLLSLLSHVARRNHWCNDPKVHNHLRPLLTDKMVKSLTPGTNLSQLGRKESLKVGLQQAGVMWRIKYKVTERGLRRALWAERPEHLQYVCNCLCQLETITNQPCSTSCRTIWSRALTVAIFSKPRRLCKDLEILAHNYTALS
jgi:xeroderma pigmentosum group C-complementing protein